MKDALELIQSDTVRQRVALSAIGEQGAKNFILSASSAISQAGLLDADPTSVYSAVITAATLGLPIHPSLGLSYIIPFRDRKSGKKLAQFQIGYKGFINLAIRSGVIERLDATIIREGQIKGYNPRTGYEFSNDLPDESKPIVGYFAFIETKTGYKSELYMSKKEIFTHAEKFSDSYKNGFGPWKTSFDEMAKKTVVKMLLNKKAVLGLGAIEIAARVDQASVTVSEDSENIDVQYIDNQNAKATIKLSDYTETVQDDNKPTDQ